MSLIHKPKSFDEIRSVYLAHDYKFYSSGPWNINLYGIRYKGKTNEFDDVIGCAYIDSFGNEQNVMFPGTTEPGAYWLGQRVGNVNGTFILDKGYWRKCWSLGLHKGRYEAFVQAPSANFTGVRDLDKDGIVDYEGKRYNDVRGLNGHGTSENLKIDEVGPYSAGCQVVQRWLEYLIWINIAKMSKEIYGNLFSYALFETDDKRYIEST